MSVAGICSLPVPSGQPGLPPALVVLALRGAR
jgi:hypothetical protein